ncbi:MAG TPA: ADP-ribosylglycohydrolase family protein [Oscillatoriales cyanobacterium M59_W2019_021]|nr:ADP-ribosylglycohydrolase family protein [Oscillatoriales cyanobacterium M4454_W2019_049]HIK53438.1 ADP-ribosylglycohydrolase family protein [Oscillatoriales cyanobacterium M59_W2019_021]
MPYSLLSRFQGSLCSAALVRCAFDHWQSLKSEPTSGSRLDGIDPDCDFDQTLSDTVLATLIQHGQPGIHLEIDRQPALRESEVDCWTAFVAIALFFHEDNARRRQGIEKLGKTISLSPASIDAADAVGYAIACILHDDLDPSALIPQTIAYLTEIEADATVRQQLATGQTLLDRGASLEETRTVFARQKATLDPSLTGVGQAIALAFYCFLSTPEDWRLSVGRSLQLSERSPLAPFVAGTLSGAYNTLSGIPGEWRMAEINSLRQAASRLYAAWAGVCHPHEIASEWGLPAVATPRR